MLTRQQTFPVLGVTHTWASPVLAGTGLCTGSLTQRDPVQVNQHIREGHLCSKMTVPQKPTFDLIFPTGAAFTSKLSSAVSCPASDRMIKNDVLNMPAIKILGNLDC